MKLVITTQIRENYGSAEKPYWKCKGGETYVVLNLKPSEIQRIKESGVPTLTSLIEADNIGYTENIIGVDIVEDATEVCESWESPYILSWKNQRWIATRTTQNDGHMRREIQSKTESYEMLAKGDRTNYIASFTMESGEVLEYKDLERYLSRAA